MWNIKILGYDFYYILSNFFLYCFLGWIYETSLVSIKQKCFINRGFLNGPVIPLYGTGATIVYLALTPVKDNCFLVFFGGCVLATVLEYFTSYVMEKLFHAKWWDYSSQRFNFQGRISLSASLLWGILSVVLLTVFKPFTDRILFLVPKEITIYACYAAVVLFVCDLAVTISETLHLDQKLAEMQKMRQEFEDYLVAKKIYNTKEELKAKWGNSRYAELKENFKSRLEERLENLAGPAGKREEFNRKALRTDIEERFLSFSNHYQKKSESLSFVHLRLLKAFPTLQSSERKYPLEDLKERIHNKRKNRKRKYGTAECKKDKK